jgi:rhomboid family protein
LSIFPIHDGMALDHIKRPYASWTLIALNVIVYFALESGGLTKVSQASVLSFGLIPAVFNDYVVLPADLDIVSDRLTLVTYAFLHGNLWHLVGNMVFLWVFADNVEDAFGHLGFLALYLVCGVAAGLAHSLGQPASLAPLIGASGAVAGVMAAYLVLFPKARIWVLLFMRIPLRISAAWALIGWFVFQFVSLLVDDGSDQMSIGWWAHIGGFVTGLAITWALRERLRERLAA